MLAKYEPFQAKNIFIKNEADSVLYSSNYVLNPYTMVKDTRSGWQTSNVQNVLNGELKSVIMSVLEKDQKS